MSVKATAWVWDHSRSGGLDRLVLLAIADDADHGGGNAYPGLEEIMRKTAMPRSTVRRRIGRLVEIGELAVDKEGTGRGHRTVYSLPGMIKGFRVDPFIGAPDVPKGFKRGSKGVQKGFTSPPLTCDDPDTLTLTQEQDLRTNRVLRRLSADATGRDEISASGAGDASSSALAEQGNGWSPPADGGTGRLAVEDASTQDWGDLADIRAKVSELGLPELLDPEYWRKIDQLTAGTGVFYLDELVKYRLWLDSTIPSKTRKDRRRQFLNWVRKALARDDYQTKLRALQGSRRA